MDFGKIDFTDDSLEVCLSSEFLTRAYTYLNVGDGNHELTIPGTSKGVGGQALLDALPFSPARVFAFGLRASQHRRERSLGEHGYAVHRARERGVEATARERRVRVDLGLRVRHDDVVKLQALGHTQRQQHHTLGRQRRCESPSPRLPAAWKASSRARRSRPRSP